VAQNEWLGGDNEIHYGQPSSNTCQMEIDVNFNYTRKYTNRLQLMDCKCEVDPTWNCVI
jgi:hypothetical protein